MRTCASMNWHVIRASIRHYIWNRCLLSLMTPSLPCLANPPPPPPSCGPIRTLERCSLLQPICILLLQVLHKILQAWGVYLVVLRTVLHKDHMGSFLTTYMSRFLKTYMSSFLKTYMSNFLRTYLSSFLRTYLSRCMQSRVNSCLSGKLHRLQLWQEPVHLTVRQLLNLPLRCLLVQLLSHTILLCFEHLLMQLVKYKIQGCCNPQQSAQARGQSWNGTHFVTIMLL